MNDEVEELEVIVKKIRYKNIVWIPEVEKTKDAGNKKGRGNPKKPYIVKWVEQKSVGDVFTKDDFYKVFPKLKKEAARRRCVDECMQDMILDGRITVHENIPGKYRVLKK